MFKPTASSSSSGHSPLRPEQRRRRQRRRISLGLLLLGLGAAFHLAFAPPRGDLTELEGAIGTIPTLLRDTPLGIASEVPSPLRDTDDSSALKTTSTVDISGDDWNLVVIAVDTLRADMLGSYGNNQGLTPNLDRLAQRGWRLTDLTSPAPWTLPSFASLMTGLHPQTHGAGSREGSGARVRRQDITPLDTRFTTLAERLHDAGFLTAGFYSNVFLNPSFGLHQGFETYREFEPMTRAEVVIDEAMTWLESIEDEQFFLFAHVFDPHAPYRPPPEADKYLDMDALHGNHGSSLIEHALRGPRIPPEQRQWASDLYRAEIAYTDAQIGRLLDAIESRADRDRTLILMVSDHGEELWEREAQRQKLGYHDRAGHGHSHYQELIHVPAILAIPGHPPGELHQGTEMIDLFPTLLGLLAVEAPTSAHQGRDLRPLIAGEHYPVPLRLSAFQLYGEARWAARWESWKLVVKEQGREVVELYDLSDDPQERHNLARSKPSIVREVRRRAERELASRVGSSEESPQSTSPPLSAETIETLQSLGYL